MCHAVRPARTDEEPARRVGYVSFREPHLGPDTNDGTDGLEESRLGRTEVSNVQVDRDVSARRTHDGSDREPHRDVHEGRERPSVHQPLQVAMVRASLPSKAHMACRGVLHGDPEPRVEGRRGDAASQILNDRVVIVHPESPCAA